MNNIESIEVNKTLTPDMWADAPAGTVNLRTKSALDRKGVRAGFTTGFIFNSLEYGFKATPRHDDGLNAKTRPCSPSTTPPARSWAASSASPSTAPSRASSRNRARGALL